MSNDLKIIVLKNFEDFGKKVDEELKKIRKTNKTFIVPTKLDRFANGEGKATISDTIRDKDLYILTDVGNRNLTYQMGEYLNHMSPDDHFQDIKRVVGAIEKHSKKTTLIMPLLYESRQHRRKSRESLDCAVALQELSTFGVDEIITYDAHNPDIVNSIPNYPFTNFFPTKLMIETFCKKEKINTKNILVISPDTGAVDRAKFYSSTFNLEDGLGLFYKRRDFSKVINGKNPIIDHMYIGANPKGKTAIIVDDMIASGDSIIDIVEQLIEKGVKETYIFVSYALFTNGIDKFKSLYKEKKFKKIYTTNLSYISDDVKKEKWMEVVDFTKHVARVIDTLNRKDSISPILEEKANIKK
ncbi:MAG: ribose-phosphate diphosphokinase [Tenericutes bacterium]|nr:ribose-phosphate diphosphokinase [Mycoplasmatota bacterium]